MDKNNARSKRIRTLPDEDDFRLLTAYYAAGDEPQSRADKKRLRTLIAEEDHRLRQVRRQYQLAQEPIVADLKRRGFRIDTVQQLCGRKRSYKSAIPILLKWLPITSDIRAKERIVEALSVPWARRLAAPALVAEFRDAPGVPFSGLKYAIGNALAVVADDSVFERISALLRDKRHGTDRTMLAMSLARMKNPRAVDLAIELLDDDEIAGHCVAALGELKAKRSRTRIRQFLRHPQEWVRTAAKRSLAQIDGAQRLRKKTKIRKRLSRRAAVR